MFFNLEILGIRIVRWLNFNEFRYNRCFINYLYVENIFFIIFLKVKEVVIFSVEFVL